MKVKLQALTIFFKVSLFLFEKKNIWIFQLFINLITNTIKTKTSKTKTANFFAKTTEKLRNLITVKCFWFKEKLQNRKTKLGKNEYLSFYMKGCRLQRLIYAICFHLSRVKIVWSTFLVWRQAESLCCATRQQLLIIIGLV